MALEAEHRRLDALPSGAERAGPFGAFPAAPPGGQWRLVARRFRRRKLAVAGLAVLAILALSADLRSFAHSVRRESHLGRRGAVSGPPATEPATPLRHRRARARPARRACLHGGTDLPSGRPVGRYGIVRHRNGGRGSRRVLRRVGRPGARCASSTCCSCSPGTALLMVAQKGLGGSLPVIVLVLGLLFWRAMARIVRGVVPVVEGAGVRRSRSCVGRLQCPDHRVRDAAQRGGSDLRPPHPGRRRRHPGRVGPIVPRLRDRATCGLVGEHAGAVAGHGRHGSLRTSSTPRGWRSC